MNASAPKDDATSYDIEKDIRAELIAHFHLTADSVEQIYESMETSSLSFSETALQLGLVTEAEIKEAHARALRVLQPPQTGLIETAIRRISSDRRVVLHQGERVTPGPQLILAHDSDHPRSEKLRALRTELLLLNEGARGANVVPVLSPNSGEGRSQLAAELAVSFAQLGRRTLLVDADFRKPQQQILFDSTNDHGLSQAITHNERPYFHAVTGLPQMHLLTAGPVPKNPLELLSDGRFEKLFSEWRNNYEFIVIDTPPVTQCADGLAIATIAAQVLVLSRAQHTSYKSARELLRRLATTQSTILGAVLNHF